MCSSRRSRRSRCPLRGSLAAGQVDDEHVHRPTREQRPGDRQTLLGVGRGQDDEPLRLDATGHGLDRVERRREVQPGHDRPRRLRLRDEPQRQRRSAAGNVAADREPHPARHAAGPEDRVELGKSGGVDAVGIGNRCPRWPEVGCLERHRRERPDDFADHLAAKP